MDVSIVCDDLLGVRLEKLQGVYFAFMYVSKPQDTAEHAGRLVGIEGIEVDAIAKVVPRQSLPNNGTTVWT